MSDYRLASNFGTKIGVIMFSHVTNTTANPATGIAPGPRFMFPSSIRPRSEDHFFRAVPALPSCIGTVFVPLHVLLPERSKHRPARPVD